MRSRMIAVESTLLSARLLERESHSSTVGDCVVIEYTK